MHRFFINNQIYVDCCMREKYYFALFSNKSRNINFVEIISLRIYEQVREMVDLSIQDDEEISTAFNYIP